MVRNADLKDTSTVTKLVAEFVAQNVAKRRWSQTTVGQKIGKSQTYVSLRIKGLNSWTTDDLDNLAKAFGYGNAFGLLDAVRGLHKSE
ncbi:hypothetical protein HMPREF0168_1105 [Bifidobacterium dentium ATCC 27679]|uniref:HTH cro/C1-type domain-containing protein n=1 Tax=Bifidobacterium dentium ATCC 27679 TaxID=871562 RepID=E0Q7J7_9BIFI|nr:hypothetical protein HMPREF0168_1105 [Bifidobacterium dentium ATCC 27679]